MAVEIKRLHLGSERPTPDQLVTLHKSPLDRALEAEAQKPLEELPPVTPGPERAIPHVSAPLPAPEYKKFEDVPTVAKPLSPVVAGVTGGIEMWARAADLMGMPTEDLINRTVRMQQDMAPEEAGAFYEGIKAVPQSLTAGAPGMIAGAALGIPAVGWAIGAGTIFSLAEYHRWMEEAEQIAAEEGLDPEVVKAALRDSAIISAIAEGGIEAATDLLGAKIFGLWGKKVATPVAKKGIQKIASAFGKYLKRTGQFGALEIPAEGLTAELQEWRRRVEGLPAAEFGEAGKSAMKATAVSTPIFGGVATGVGAVQTDIARKRVAAEKQKIRVKISRVEWTGPNLEETLIPVEEVDVEPEAPRIAEPPPGETDFEKEPIPYTFSEMLPKEERQRSGQVLLSNAFPGAEVNPVADNRYELTLPNGMLIVARDDATIEVPPEVGERGMVATGKWRTITPTTGGLWLAKEADQGTVYHEAFHAAMGLVLTGTERQQILQAYGNEEAAAEAYAKWDGTEPNTVFEKIRAFFKNFMGTYRRGAEQGIFQEIRAGKVWDRTPNRAAEVGSTVREDTAKFALRVFSQEKDVEAPAIAKAILADKPISSGAMNQWRIQAKNAGVSARAIENGVQKFKDYNGLRKKGGYVVLPQTNGKPLHVVIREGVMNTSAVEGPRRQRLDKLYEAVQNNLRNVEVGALYGEGTQRPDIPTSIRGLEPRVFLNLPSTDRSLQKERPSDMHYPVVITGNPHLTNFERPHPSWDTNVKAVRVKPVLRGNKAVNDAIVEAINYANEVGAHVLVTTYRSKNLWNVAKYTNIVPTDPNHPDFDKYWKENPLPQSTEKKKRPDYTPWVPRSDRTKEVFREAGWQIEKNIYGEGGTWWWPTSKEFEPDIVAAINPKTPIEYCDLFHKGCPTCRNCQKVTHPEAAGAPIFGVTDEPFCEHSCPQCFVRLGQSGIKGRKSVSIKQNLKQQGFGEKDLGDLFGNTTNVLQKAARHPFKKKGQRVDYISKFFEKTPAEAIDLVASLYLDNQLEAADVQAVQKDFEGFFGEIASEIYNPLDEGHFQLKPRKKIEVPKAKLTPKADAPDPVHVESEVPPHLYAESAKLKWHERPKAWREQRKAEQEIGLWDEYIATFSTRLEKINPELKRAFRRFQANLDMTTQADQAAIAPWLAAMKKLSRKYPKDSDLLDLALKNGDAPRVQAIVDKYGLGEAYEAMRSVLADMHERLEASGFDVGYLEDYHPRSIKDLNGLFKELRTGPDWGIFQQAIAEKARQSGVKVADMDKEEKAAVIDSVLRGYGDKLGLYKPGNIKERKIRHLDGKLNKYYHGAGASLLMYVDRMNEVIATRAFFGKGVDLDMRLDVDTIGAYVETLVDQGKIPRDKQDELVHLMKVRFDSTPMMPYLQRAKNWGYIYSMGSVTNAMTQIGDFAWAAYMAPLQTPVAAARAIVKKSKTSRQDIGVEKIAQEFGDIKGAAKILNTVFKLTGLTYADSLGKETLINATLDRYRAQARRGKFSPKLKRIFDGAFAPDERAVVMEDLAAGRRTDDIDYLAHYVLSEFQPINKNEMPVGYLKSPNGRVLYMLKTFTIKQFDVFRNEAIATLRSKEATKVEKAQAFTRLMHLAGVFVMANASADKLKDWLLGRETSFGDVVEDNVMRLFGFSKFLTWYTRRYGVKMAVLRNIAPPITPIGNPMYEAFYRDIGNFYTTAQKDELDDFTYFQGREWPKRVPLVGKLYYWWFGGGREWHQKYKAKEEEKKRKDRGGQRSRRKRESR